MNADENHQHNKKKSTKFPKKIDAKNHVEMLFDIIALEKILYYNTILCEINADFVNCLIHSFVLTKKKTSVSKWIRSNEAAQSIIYEMCTVYQKLHEFRDSICFLLRRDRPINYYKTAISGAFLTHLQ